MRRYDDPVEVRRGETRDGGPEQFLWRGRLWQVRAVLATWVETAPWWQGTTDGRTEHGDDRPVGHELWRGEGGRGPGTSGVFDLSFARTEGSWQLVGCAD